MNDLETLAPPAWTGPTIGELNDLAANGSICQASADACTLLVQMLGFDPIPVPHVRAGSGRQAALYWLTDNDGVAVGPYWTRDGKLACWLGVWRDGVQTVGVRHVPAIETLRRALVTIYPFLRGRLDGPEVDPYEDGVRAFVQRIKREGRLRQAGTRPVYKLDAVEYRIVSEECYQWERESE